MPKVSIGMPVFNGEKYLEEALNSLLVQTHSNIEILISNNASTDRTAEICAQFAEADNRVKYFLQDRTIPVLDNFEYILSKAEGNFFMWAACDDVWEENWISSLIAGIKESNVDAAYGCLMHIDEHSSPIAHVANSRIFKFTGPRIIRRLKYFLEPERLGKANPIYGLFKLEKIEKLKPSNYNVDYEIVYSILENTGLVAIPQSKLYKRIHSGSEGNKVSYDRNKLTAILKKFIEPLKNPFTFVYFKHSNFVERVLLLFFLPIKLILEYIFLIRYLVFLLSRKNCSTHSKNKVSL